jgi:glycine/D-amino acid oxidase-like deaminating enzyme
VFEEFAAERRAQGVHVEVLDAERAHEAAPILGPEVIGATYCPEEGQVDTTRFVRTLAHACRARGVRIHEGVTALGVLRAGGRAVGVRTAWGDVPAGAVVWCGGAWSRSLVAEGLDVPIKLERIGCVLTSPVEEELNKTVFGPVAMKQYALIRSQPSFREEDFADPREDGAESGIVHIEAMSKRDDGRLLLGCPMDSPAAIDETMPFRGLKLVIDRFLEVFPRYSGLGIEDTWSGVIPTTADTLPIVGEMDDLPGLFLGTGHIYGNLAGPISGKLLAQLVAGVPTALPVEALSPSRSSLVAAGVTTW